MRQRSCSASMACVRTRDYPLLLLLAAITIAAKAGHAQTVIVLFKQDAVAAAAAVSAASAGADVAAAAASAAAEARGASAAKQAAVAMLAAKAAVAQAAVASLSSEVQASAASAGLSIQHKASYSTVLQGAAYSAADAAAAAKLKQQLEQRPDVEGVYFAREVEPIAPIDQSKLGASSSSGAAAAQPADASTTEAGPTVGAAAGVTVAGYGSTTGLNKLTELGPGLDGTGQLLCVIDTGVGYKKLLGCTGVNQPSGCPLVTGYDLVGNQYNGKLTGPPRVQDNDPEDCMGHGTTVTSVAASSYGIAKGAKLGVYKVFGCAGVSTDDIIIEAIDRAVRDGCDIINLSLAGKSGYAERSVYAPVTRAALDKGILVVKAAGNYGLDDGAFTADVAVAAGAIAVGAVGGPGSLQLNMMESSSFGPSPTLTLAPHLSAPGKLVPVITKDGFRVQVDGTSFSSPYVAGVLALWLQHKQQQAAAAGQVLDPASVNQDAAMRALVSTAATLPDFYRPAWRQTVAWTGAGVIQADALLFNQLSVEPMMLSLPSGLTGTYTTSIKLTWTGPRNPSRTMVTYNIRHEPSVSVKVADGFYNYGLGFLPSQYIAAQVRFNATRISLNSGLTAHSKTVQVTFTFPPGLTNKELLYSGIIRIVPVPRADENTTISRAVWPLSLPYMGHTRDWSSVRVLAQPRGRSPDAATLRNYENSLCYAPNSQPNTLNAILDDRDTSVQSVCTGGLTAPKDTTLNVSLAVLKKSPECSLRLVLVPEIPIQWLYVELLDDASGSSLGFFNSIDVSSGDCKADAADIDTYCLRFDGSYSPPSGSSSSNGSRQWLQAGTQYRVNAIITGPLAAGDAPLGKTALNTTVPIRGRFLVTA